MGTIPLTFIFMSHGHIRVFLYDSVIFYEGES